MATNKKLWTITGSLAAAALITAGASLAIADDNGARDRGTTVRIPAPAASATPEPTQDPTDAPSEPTASTIEPTPTPAPAPAPASASAPAPAPAPKPKVYHVDSADSYSAPSASS